MRTLIHPYPPAPFPSKKGKGSVFFNILTPFPLLKGKGLGIGVILAFVFCLCSVSAFSEERFPRPEFESSYAAPVYQHPLSRGTAMEYADTAVLIITLLLASYFSLKRRSRRGLFLVMAFSLAYFGFYRHGCICPVGSIQNVASAFFDNTYSIPITVVLFFLLPIVTTLFFGRSFCASVCPLGAAQDIVAVRPVAVPKPLARALSLIPYLYLGAAIIFAATGASYLICRFDPFVSFFRLSGDVWRLSLGGIFLLLAVFVARPYCRFLCPYGAILNLVSRVSIFRVTITPTDCIKCRRCENACPFDAIETPVTEDVKKPSARQRIILAAVFPVSMAIFAVGASGLTSFTAGMHSKVSLARQIDREERAGAKMTYESRTYRSLGASLDDLANEAASIERRFAVMMPIAGALFGLAVAVLLFSLAYLRPRNDYEPNRGNCVSCGRCFAYCPRYYRPKAASIKEN